MNHDLSQRDNYQGATASILLGLFLLSASTLIFEINLTRLFSVAQFYHFAFMIVSVALLGFGASGTILAIFPQLGRINPQKSLSILAFLAGSSFIAAYLLTNWLPFDSFSIAWDRNQVLILTLHYLALATPFFFSGMAVGLLISVYSNQVGKIYAVNLTGSSIGCLLALVTPAYLSGEGVISLSSGLAFIAAFISIYTSISIRFSFSYLVYTALLLFLTFFVFIDLGIRIFRKPTWGFLELQLSPYKSLSYALQYPQAEVVFHEWNAFSRIDVVQSEGIRSLPGLSYRFLSDLPPQDGVLIDGDDLNPLIHPGSDLQFTEYLPAAIAYQLRPNADVLILEPRGGLDIITALASGANNITAVEVNPLIIDAASHIYDDSHVDLYIETDRSYLSRTGSFFDIIHLSLTSSYHPIRSGAYTLAEDYQYTLEALNDSLARLKPDGFLVISRWLQDPPSEFLRAFSLAVTALESSSMNPKNQIVAFRGYNLGTLLIKNGEFTQTELQSIRNFSASLAFDLIYSPDIQASDINQFNILPEPIYYQTFHDLLNSQPRSSFYKSYPYDVEPATDDHPFYGHYFKWSQAGQVLAELGKTWQPFGGAGYFVILALLILASLSAGILIILPVILASITQNKRGYTEYSKPESLTFVIYFGLIGLAFMLVEIPLIQRFILYLGHPSYALTVVLFSILLFSGIGSYLNKSIPLILALLILVILLVLSTLFLPILFDKTLGLSFGWRIILTTVVLSPIGFFMGIPFPRGITSLLANTEKSSLIPWVWGVNGASSVVSAVLAALLALSFGFTLVFRLGAMFYIGALLTSIILTRPNLLRYQRQ